MEWQTLAVTRIFDEQKAKDLYLGYLGMKLDWAHRFAPAGPRYMQVSKASFTLHFSEHSGDASPESKVLVHVSSIPALFDALQAREYPYCKPSMEAASWGR